MQTSIINSDTFGTLTPYQLEDGSYVFSMSEIAEHLGYVRDQVGHGHSVRYDKMFSILDRAAFDTLPLKGCEPQERFLTEEQLYCLIFKSEKPEAMEFMHWVCTEVLPALRKGFFVPKKVAVERLYQVKAHACEDQKLIEDRTINTLETKLYHIQDMVLDEGQSYSTYKYLTWELWNTLLTLIKDTKLVGKKFRVKYNQGKEVQYLKTENPKYLEDRLK